MKDEISTEELQQCALQASTEAQARAKALKIPYTVQKGKSIVRRNPDGSKEVVGKLPKAYVRPKQKCYRVA